MATFGGIGTVVPGEVAAGEQARSGSLQKSWGDREVFGSRDAVGAAEIGRALAVDGRGAAAAVQGRLVDGADGGDAGNLRGVLIIRFWTGRAMASA